MPRWVITQPKFLAESHAHQLAQNLFASPLTSPNTLGGTFSASRGFALSFTRDGLPSLAKRFGQLHALTQRLLAQEISKKMVVWYRRRHHRPSNAFYLNFLLLNSKHAIAPHVDATLAQEVGGDSLTPEVVSVIYLDVSPQMRGGELVIYGPHQKSRTIVPKSGKCVHFRGDLTHEIKAIENADMSRMSLVLEQYRFSDDQLKKLSPFKIYSKTKFSMYLKSEWQSQSVLTSDPKNLPRAYVPSIT